MNEYILNNAILKVCIDKDGIIETLIQEEDDFWKKVKSISPNIKNIHLSFRKILWPDVVKPNADGYFFSHGILAVPGSLTKMYSIGHISLEHNKIYIKKIIIPELILFEEEERDLDISDPRVIINRDV